MRSAAMRKSVLHGGQPAILVMALMIITALGVQAAWTQEAGSIDRAAYEQAVQRGIDFLRTNGQREMAPLVPPPGPGLQQSWPRP